MNTAVQTILDHLENVRQTGSCQWQARCPVHDDQHPSLSVGLGDDGRVLLKCHAGCAAKDILTTMGLTERDLFAEKPPSKTVAATYDYRDAQGVLLYQVIRYSDKTFQQRRPDGNGGWTYSVKGLPRVLYRLPELLAADPEAWIFIVEGEKDVDNLVHLGLVATTNSGGAGKWKHLSDTSALEDRSVVVIPDKDKAGYCHAQEVCQHLSGKAKEIRYLAIEGPGKDVTDWLKAGGSPDKLLDLVATASKWSPQVCLQTAWPQPQPLGQPLPEVLPFDTRLLPGTFHDWIGDIAERMQCPVDFPAVTAMIALAGVVGRKIGIHPKRYDDWTVIPNLWGALIGRPSTMKSPPLKATLKPLESLMDTATAEYSDQLSAFEKERDIAHLQKSVLEGKIKSAMRGGKEFESLRLEMEALDALVAPLRRRYVVNDCTVQALGQILSENPNGVIVVRDELIGLLKVLESQGQEAARAFYLEGWNGNGRHETDRIGRGNIQIEAVCLSIIGTIQPGPLREYLHQAVEGGIGDDGLIQRFQLAVWPDDPAEWKNIDRYPDFLARNEAFKVFSHVNSLTPDAVDATPEMDDPRGVPFLHFTPQAQERFDEWMVARENRLRQGLEEGAMESHLTKYRSLIPSLALLIHLAEFRTGNVDLDAIERAIDWGDYLASHARRIYASAQAASWGPEHQLLAKIQQGDLEDGFTIRQVYTHHWTGLSNKQTAEEAVGILTELGWIRPEKQAGGGRPTTVYRIYPNLNKFEKSLKN